MSSIHKFEDIQGWQEARKLSKALYQQTQSGRFSKDWGLIDQVQRAGVSVMTNIVEGFDSGSNLEFVRFLNYARRSASEIQSLLYVALDQSYIPQSVFQELYEQAEKVRRLVTSFRQYLRKTRQRTNAPTRQRIVDS